MIRSFINWPTVLVFILIVSITGGTIWYSNYLSEKIIREEKEKVEQWVAAGEFIQNNPSAELTLPNMIKNEQRSIPIIETDERDSITNYVNLDSAKVLQDTGYLKRKMREFRAVNEPFILVLTDSPYIANKYYYGNTQLAQEIRYFPLIQLLIVGIIIFFVILFITTRSAATQNLVWAGMAKETAHQLGTPITSLQGWVEILREDPKNDTITRELQKDVDRLKLVSDRFGKIGSKPQLEEVNIVTAIEQMLEYIKKRAPGKVQFSFDTHGATVVNAQISVSIFDWVIENLLKNALDAMEGKGSIKVDLKETVGEVIIDVTDSGKGIPPAHYERVFKPGYTTKKRGWGLGLTLSRRIIEQYHRGQLSIKSSEPGKGTTFRITLKK